MWKDAGLLWSLEHVFTVCTFSYQNYLWTEACAVRQDVMVCFVHAGGKLHPRVVTWFFTAAPVLPLNFKEMELQTHLFPRTVLADLILQVTSAFP